MNKIKNKLSKLLDFLILKASKYGEGKRYEMITVKRKDGRTYTRKQLVGSKKAEKPLKEEPQKEEKPVKKPKPPKAEKPLKEEPPKEEKTPNSSIKVAYNTRQYVDYVNEAREKIKNNHVDISNLKWSKEFPKCTLEQAIKNCPKGWRLPSIEELWTAHDTKKIGKWWMKFWSSSKVPVIDATFSLTSPSRWQWVLAGVREYEDDENGHLIDQPAIFDDINVMYVKDASPKKPLKEEPSKEEKPVKKPKPPKAEKPPKKIKESKNEKPKDRPIIRSWEFPTPLKPNNFDNIFPNGFHYNRAIHKYVSGQDREQLYKWWLINEKKRRHPGEDDPKWARRAVFADNLSGKTWNGGYKNLTLKDVKESLAYANSIDIKKLPSNYNWNGGDDWADNKVDRNFESAPITLADVKDIYEIPLKFDYVGEFDRYVADRDKSEKEGSRASSPKDNIDIKNKKYNDYIDALRELEKEINQWYNSSRNTERTANSKKRYKLQAKWEKLYEWARSTPDWKTYIKENRKANEYTFNDVVA